MEIKNRIEHGVTLKFCTGRTSIGVVKNQIQFFGLVGPDKAVLGMHPGGCSLTQARLTTNRDKAIVGQMHLAK
jgi:hypothetical protein